MSLENVAELATQNALAPFLTYRCNHRENIIELEGFDHVNLRSGADEAGKNSDDKEHQSQDLHQRRLVGVGDYFLRGSHVGQGGGRHGDINMLRQ